MTEFGGGGRERERGGLGDSLLGVWLDFDVLSGRHRKRISSRYMPRSCMSLFPLRFRYRRYLPIRRCVRRCISVCTEIQLVLRARELVGVAHREREKE